MHVGESVPAANNSDQVEASSSESKPEQKLGNLSANIIPHLFKLYDCTATAADYEIYAPKAVFEDPLMQAHGYLRKHRLWTIQSQRRKRLQALVIGQPLAD
ncbi:hypothetical protein CY35_04G123000 [Sphagnum magellanicum]|nr:hypothetical protein CY35_04G123000 [Sphagnum magellanicum]KAH9566276.1 hypothetical protein CY35_04G123000 [Sphagnum magellanicum]